MNIRKTKYGISPYCPPEKLMRECEYRTRVDAIGKNRNLTEADEQFFSELEDLRNDLYDMITYNQDILDVKGTKYYVSADGNDNNDGLTPETAWATLEKVSTFEFDVGDGVYFKRGDLWRGNLVAKSGVTYQAFGTGEKPKIWFSFDGKTAGKWVKTDMENIWVLDTPLNTSDVGVILFNGGEKYANKKRKIADIKQELDFCFAGECSNEDTPDDKAYLYCSSGNPGEIFSEIELSRRGSTITIANYSHDIYLHNLELRFGQDYFFMDYSKNINMSYCLLAWMGGHYFGKNGCRYGGGGGCWHSCDNVQVHHNYFTQQFDCSCTAQFSINSSDTSPAIFKDFKFYDNLVEYCEWSFEYYNDKKNPENKYDGFYLGYNFMRKCGYGFGEKPGSSRHIRSGGSVNTCYNSLFESNIFDRARYLSVDICSRIGKRERNSGDIDYDSLQKLKNNIYIEPRNKHYADINLIPYNFNQAAQITLKRLGVEEDSVFIFAPENQE